MDKVLVFDIWGDYAHFRKYYTTTSPLSFSFPPRTTVAGIISAIIGLDKDEYLKFFAKKDANIGLRICQPIKKVRIAENLINTKDGYFTPIKKGTHEPRTQIRFEFIKDPKYRIYINHNDKEVYTTLKDYLKGHKSVFTPSLGLSENLANFEYIGEFLASNKTGQQQIDSVIPVDCIVGDRVDFGENGEYFTSTIPVEMSPDRIVSEYREVLFERNGGKIKAEVKEYWALSNGENITIL